MLKTLEGRQDAWPSTLQGTLFAFRTSVQKSTGYSPFYLMYGRDSVLPVDLQVTSSDCASKDAGNFEWGADVSKRVASMLQLRDAFLSESF